MKNVTINGKPVSPTGPPLISRTAILILSSVLVGTAIGHGSLDGIYFYCFNAGITGLISFLGLDYLAEHRLRQTVRREMESANVTISARIERHVFAACRLPTLKPAPKLRHESPWLTVNVR